MYVFPAGELRPAAHRNVCLFQGFCAMKYAVYAVCVSAHRHASCGECVSVLHQLLPDAGMDRNTTSSEGEKSSSSDWLIASSGCFTSLCPPGCRLLFQLYLSECQLYLEAVPAMFRLELLENIFSLLFLSSWDFQSISDSSSTTGSEMGQTEVGCCENQKLPLAAAHRGHLELGHFVQGCRGFLVDVTAMEGFLKLLKKALDGINGVGEGPQEAEAASLGCSVTPETFESRRQRLSKRTAEAQWRLQIVTSNQGVADGELQEKQTKTSSCFVVLL